MVNRRSFVEAILGAGASLVGLVIGKREEVAGWTFGDLAKGICPRFSKKIGPVQEAGGMKFQDCVWAIPRTIVTGSGPAFHRLLDEWGRLGVWDKFKRGVEAPLGSGKRYVSVVLDRRLRLIDIGEGFALYAQTYCGTGIQPRLGTLKELRAAGVTFISTESMVIDLT